MRLFDTLIDNFSAKDLRTRVTGVIIVGFVVCAAVGMVCSGLGVVELQAASARAPASSTRGGVWRMEVSPGVAVPVQWL